MPFDVNLKEKECVMCKKPYIPSRASQLYCTDECRNEQKRIRSKEFREKQKATKKNKKKSLRTIATEARKAGMSYGKYVAMLEMEEK